MIITNAELDLLLDIISTHLVRHEDGQDIAQGWETQDVQEILERLSEEVTLREVLEGIPADVDPQLIDPFDMPQG